MPALAMLLFLTILVVGVIVVGFVMIQDQGRRIKALEDKVD